MFVLIWAALLFSVRGSHADTDPPLGTREYCYNRFCITLREGELTAEAGLCVVIPCSFTTGYGFLPQSLVWFKCAAQSRCFDSDIVYHKNNRKVQAGFKGRVTLLEPDLSRNYCSIMINDLIESDSGSYQLRVNGLLYGNPDGFTFFQRATVSVKGLNQKPTVVIPPMTEGQQTSLTCAAPGLCSGSRPEITWMFREAGGNYSHIAGNITDFQTNLTAVTQRHSSTLTFTPSAEHHGTNVTCKISFTGDTTTEETLTLNVNYAKEVKITGDRSMKEGDTLNLTCSVDSFPPSLVMWGNFSDQHVQNGTETNLQNDTEAYLQEEGAKGSFSISNVTAEHSGQYICTAKYLNNTLTAKVNVTVIYKRNPRITGDTTVKEGDVLNLTCGVESFPPSLITWRKLPAQHNTTSNTGSDLQNDTGSATLVIPNVTAEHSGEYVCTTKYLNTTETLHADVTVTWFSKIQNGSGCVIQSEVLTCACISEGFPLPTIKWPLLKNHREYSVITTVSNHTVNSTVTLTVKSHGNTAVECVSSSGNEEAKENLPVRINLPETVDESTDLLTTASRLEIIIAFLAGALLSGIICCLAKTCHRKKKRAGNLDETVELVTSQDNPLIYDGQAVRDDQTQAWEAAENGAVAAERASPELNRGPKDVEYASINFSLLKRKSDREAVRKQESTETEYAEIKKEVKEEREDDGGEGGEFLEGEEEEVMLGEDEETKHYVPEEAEGEEEAVYSSVNDIMDQI